MAHCKPILYSYFRSSCSWRVRIALAYKGIDYECKTVDLLAGQQYSESYLKINPTGEVPVYVDNGKTITNSTAILEYLEETVPNAPLLPTDPVKRAQVRGLVDNIVAGIQPLQNMKVLFFLGEKAASWGGEKSVAFGKHWVESGLKSLEKKLQGTHGKYCVGDNVTFADLCLIPQVYNAEDRFDINLSNFPLISEISSRLKKLDAFEVSHPDNQPDSP
ncbi:maleylacetoacetate isomerase [Parasteatoda tepidariorum]|uniref:maleylacetoacetate isomerase n=1 Tax=Parasteatoda tepidariorum TaxID=114398 RepID=A0A2L2YDQ1_PARTP|nr:maleylacetoacetate isomerase-like [Parasteatoda tepidariorum]